MFLYQFQQNPEDPIFQTPKLPRLLRISRSHENHQWSYPYHAHKDRIEIAYIECGLAYYKIDMHAVTAKKGELVVIDRGTLHTVNTDADYPTNIWVLHANHFQFPDLEPDKLLIDRQFTVLDPQKNLPFVDGLFRGLKNWYEIGESKTCNIMAHGLSTLLLLLYELQKDITHLIPDSSQTFAKDVILYLNENYNKPLTLLDLSEHFHMSSSYISHEFSRQFGISPINYLINRKLCEAKWLLSTSDKPVDSIAYSLGYENPSYFNKLFTKRTGISPGEYRNTYAESKSESKVEEFPNSH